ncbi:MAG TPA: anti-sigma factor [Planctomycetota bacterium]|nr:anti-sigma factor [Planctomycetota bacterium]
MSTNCADFHELLSALADGELPEAERARVQAHADGCPECRRLLERFRRLDAVVAGGLTPPPVPAERWTRMLADVTRAGRARQTAVLRPAPGRLLRAAVWTAAAAAVLALVVSLALHRGGNGPRAAEYSSAQVVAVAPSDGDGQILVLAAPEGGLSLVIVSTAPGNESSGAGTGG